jgi:hypothetical protein
MQDTQGRKTCPQRYESGERVIAAAVIDIDDLMLTQAHNSGLDFLNE